MADIALILAFKDGKILFGKRNDNGKYTLPGGHLEEGEDPSEGAKRELDEETGLSPVGDIELVEERKLGNSTLHIFQCEVDGEPTGENDPDEECDEWKFYDLDAGVPKDLQGKLAGPKNQSDNFIVEEYGLAKAQQESEDIDIDPSAPEKEVHMTHNQIMSEWSRKCQ